MSALLLILLSAVLVNVMALTRMPAWRPFEAAVGTFKGAQGLAAASLICANSRRRTSARAMAARRHWRIHSCWYSGWSIGYLSAR